MGAGFVAGSGAPGLGAAPEMAGHAPRGCWRRRSAATTAGAGAGDGLDVQRCSRAVESGPALRVARTEEVAVDAVVRLLRAADASIPLCRGFCGGGGTTAREVLAGMGSGFLARRSC